MDSSHEYWIGYRNKLSLRQNHPLEATRKCPHILQTWRWKWLSRVTKMAACKQLTLSSQTSLCKWTGNILDAYSEVWYRLFKSQIIIFFFWQFVHLLILQNSVLRFCSHKNPFKIGQDWEWLRCCHLFSWTSQGWLVDRTYALTFFSPCLNLQSLNVNVFDLFS